MVSHYPAAAAKRGELPSSSTAAVVGTWPARLLFQRLEMPTVAALGTLGTLPRSNNEQGAAVRLDVSHALCQPCLLRATSTNTYSLAQSLSS